MFVDRRSELAWLEARRCAPDAQLLVVYGKRRVGKTALLREFIRGGPAVYCLADRRPGREQLREVAARLGAHFGDAFVAEKGFANWLEVFEFLRTRLAGRPRRRGGRFVLVLDEFPYLVENDSATPSLFQKGWDETLARLPLCLVLCGSSVAVMESEALSARSPLFGRRTGDLVVRPFDFAAVREYVPAGWSFERTATLYAMLGGMPGYLRQFDLARSLEWNVRERLLAPGAFLFREVEFLLKEELREPRSYLAVLRAIAQGRRRFGEIVNDTGLEKNVLHKYLHVLERLQLMEREVPVTERAPERSKRSLYRLADPFVALWFACVHAFHSDLELGETGPALRRFREVLPHLAGAAYERIAAEVLRRPGTAPARLERVGRWWDASGEVDVVGVNEEQNAILFAEVKWSGRPLGTNVLEGLRAAAARVVWGRPDRREVFALFGRGGFTPELRRVAKREHVLLFEGDRRVV